MNESPDYEYQEMHRAVATLRYLYPFLTEDQAIEIYETDPDIRGMLDGAVELLSRIQHVAESKNLV